MGGAASCVELNLPFSFLVVVNQRNYHEMESLANLVSRLEPHAADVPPRDGFEVVTISKLEGAEARLYRLWLEAGAYPPGGEPSFEEWRRVILDSPLLEPRGSFTVLAGRRPVSLAWLLVDWDRNQAEHEWTATAPDFRGQGLARFAKLHAIRWAAENGIREILTDNEEDNVAMLELNRSLGYQPLWRRRSFRRAT